MPCIKGVCVCVCMFYPVLPNSAGHDVIAQAQSGTGKTATFAIAILQKIDITKQNCQALVLAPTRELAQQVWTLYRVLGWAHSESVLLSIQIQKVVIALGDYMHADCHACIGGTNIKADMTKLERGQHVVVGTPGRVFDMMNRKALGRFAFV